MKREIKFRGLAKDSNWYYGDLICDDMGARICYVDYIPPSLQDPCGDTQFIKINIDYATVGQYIGLKDKNGKEIYEGDIIAIYYSRNGIETNDIFIKRQVKWGIYNMPINGGEYTMDIVGPYVEDEFLYSYLCSNATTIIGNIYQNPELL